MLLLGEGSPEPQKICPFHLPAVAQSFQWHTLMDLGSLQSISLQVILQPHQRLQLAPPSQPHGTLDHSSQVVGGYQQSQP